MFIKKTVDFKKSDYCTWLAELGILYCNFFIFSQIIFAMKIVPEQLKAILLSLTPQATHSIGTGHCNEINSTRKFPYFFENICEKLLQKEYAFLGGGGGFVLILFLKHSALLHLPPLRFHCADGCWDRTQDRCILCIGSQTL